MTCTKVLLDSQKHHFADGTSIVQFNPLLERLLKQVNKDNLLIKPVKLQGKISELEGCLFVTQQVIILCWKQKLIGKSSISGNHVW